MLSTQRAARTATLIAAAATAGLGTVAATGTAAADQHSYTIAARCESLNPNILDLPYSGGVTIWTDTTRPGTFDLYGDSKSLFPYTTDSTITVTDVKSGNSQVFHRRWGHGLADGVGYMINDIPGHGQVRITLRATNHGLLTMPAAPCSGAANIPG